MQVEATLLKKLREHKEEYWGPSDHGKASLLFFCWWVVTTISQSLSGRWTNDSISLQKHQIYLYFIDWIDCQGKSIENIEPYDLLQVVNNDENLLQTKQINVGFVDESEIKRLLQTKTGYYYFFTSKVVLIITI